MIIKNSFITSFLLFCLFSTTGIGQENEKSLLWKITSPKTEKASYLYGTMHISGRLAFHLGEEFFTAIEEVDAIALESNPIIWLEEIFASEFASDYLGKYGIRYQTYKGFYQEAFKLTVPDNNNFAKALANDHYLSNWMLYRENKSQRDFQEETFLDLFIYQTGMKNDKPVYSLERFDQSRHYSKLGDMADPEKKEYDGWYEKLTEDKNAMTLIREAYRNKDVLLLDSLHRQINSANFYKYMLVERNTLMAYRADSIISKEGESLFIGIGAAHLAGPDGVIQMLRDKGYTVEAMSTTITESAADSKTKLDKQKKSLSFNIPFESDMFSLKVPELMYETPSGASYQRQFFAPELTNGSFFYVKQLSHYGFFTKTDEEGYISKIDSLLFENIPGNIIEKRTIVKDGFNGLDIVNETSNGNYERFNIIFTPLNVFIFKMGGKDVFVKNSSSDFFNTIKLKQVGDNWEDFASARGGFKLKLPEYYTAKANDKITGLYDHPEIQAYDPEDGSYYLFKRASLFDNIFIEEDEYELKRLADQFCDNLEIEEVEVEIIEDALLPTAMAYARTPDSSYLSLKVLIKGPFYYLMAQVSKENNINEDFYNSLELTEFTYKFPFKTKRDSTLMFSVNSNYLYPTMYTDMYAKANVIRDENLSKKKEDFSHEEWEIKRTYYSENYERIYVSAYKFHDYEYYPDVDSLWRYEVKRLTKKNKLIVRSESNSKDGNIHLYNATLSDTNSSRTIEAKYFLKHGMMYRLLTNSDTISGRSKFVSEFYNSFTPFDTLVGRDPLENKANLFFTNIYSNDSITKKHAIESVEDFDLFEDEHAEKLIEVIKNFPFAEKQVDTKKQLIVDLGSLKNKNIVPFLTELYPQLEDTSAYQIGILRALTRQKTKEATEAFVDMLEYDIPLAGNNFGMYSVFYPYYDTLELTSQLYPELLNYTFVEDYKNSVYYLLNAAVKKDYIKPKSYKKYYKQILREGKIELKSQISYEQAEKNKETNKYYYSSYKNKGNYLLVIYSRLLLPFIKKPGVSDYFEKLKKVEDYEVRTDIAILFEENGINVPKEEWEYLAEDIINKTNLYKTLERKEMLDLFPKAYLNQEAFATSILYNQNFNTETDSMEFIKKLEMKVKGKEGYVYFYKSKREKDDDWELDYVGLQPIDQSEVSVSKVVYSKGIKLPKHKTVDEVIEDELENIEIIGHPRAKKKSNGSYFWW